MSRGSEGDRKGAGPRPGALSALLQEIAAAPREGQGGAWEATLRPGARVGRFELVRELGRGGFGVVWEARDRELGRSVAFKAVRAGGKATLREERLLREAEAAARLQHPNIVTLFDVGRAEQGPYLVLELLRGQTLEERLAGGPVPPGEAAHVAAEIARAVAHAHGEGVIHRDLKPANVFLCQDGPVKVLDFGMAHAFGRRKAEGGTSGYMAPEQVAGAPEDERTDVFALGVILHQMLTGRRPFEDEKALRSRSAAPVLEVPGQPDLGDLVGRMLAKDPLGRPRDGGEVLSSLQAFQEMPEAAPPSGPVRTRPKARLRMAGLVAAGVLAGALGAGGAAWWRGVHRSSAPPDVVEVALAELLRKFHADGRPLPPWFVARVRLHVDQLVADPRTRAVIYPRMKQHWPMLSRKFAEYGLPEELGYIAWAESGFDPAARSNGGGVGLWQFQPRTAREFGLRVEEGHDDRLDPVLSTDAAARYLAKLMALFGSDSFMLAIAGYNKGESGVLRVLFGMAQEPGGLRPEDRNFWYFYRRKALPEETMEYVPRVLAIAVICHDPHRYGLE